MPFQELHVDHEVSIEPLGEDIPGGLSTDEFLQEKVALSYTRPTRHALTLDETIQDPECAMPNWWLITFYEFDKLLKLLRENKISESVKMRLGSSSTVEEQQIEMRKIGDLRMLMLTQIRGTLEGMMLDEAKRVFRERHLKEPANLAEVRLAWKNDSSVSSAEATWQVLYGLFDRLDSKSKKDLWENKLERLIMKKMQVAYIKQTVPPGSSKGGPKAVGCVRALISYSKQELVKNIQKSGKDAHGHSIVLKKPNWAAHLFPGKEVDREKGVMQPYMYYHESTKTFPMRDGKTVTKLPAGKVVLPYNKDELEGDLRSRINLLEEKNKKLQEMLKKDRTHLSKSLSALAENTRQVEEEEETEKARATASDMTKKQRRRPKTARTHRQVVDQLPVDPWLELEEGESYDEVTCPDKDGDDITGILGSTVVDGKLKVFVQWDNSNSKVSLEEIGPVYQDMRELFEGMEAPRIKKWIEANKEKYPLDDDEETESEKSKQETEEEFFDLPPPPTYSCKHDEVVDFEREENAAFCGTNYYLHDSACRQCHVKFVEKVKDKEKEYKPNTDTPVMYCLNFKAICRYAVCVKCYLEKLESGTRRRRGR
jgi:hypothetical protein